MLCLKFKHIWTITSVCFRTPYNSKLLPKSKLTLSTFTEKPHILIHQHFPNSIYFCWKIHTDIFVFILQDMRGQQAAEQTLLTATTINCTSGDSPTPTVTMTSSNPSDKLEPVWVAPWGFPRHVSMTSQGSSSHGHPHSSVSPLTQMDLEVIYIVNQFYHQWWMMSLNKRLHHMPWGDMILQIASIN